MKKIISIVLIFALLISVFGCSLFSNDSIVKLGDYTHNDPSGLSYDERIILKGDNFGSTLESFVNSAAYPDTMIYDNDGNLIGMYNYDEKTGMAIGKTDIATGEYTPFSESEQIDLGMPDESKLISIPGDTTLYFVVYGEKEAAVSAYMYVFLTDASAADTIIANTSSIFGIDLKSESDTVLTAVIDSSMIAADFANYEAQGETFEKKDAATYAEILSQTYGVREDMGVNPYKPYEGHEDPDDIEYDQRVVLTGSGEAAVTEEYTKDVSSMTEYVYGKDGEVVAMYTYLETPSKEAADELMDNKVYPTAERVSDTVILVATTGQDMQDELTAYMGYNVIKDKSVDEFVRMLQETFFTSVCE